jgi:hypothetical protein
MNPIDDADPVPLNVASTDEPPMVLPARRRLSDIVGVILAWLMVVAVVVVILLGVRRSRNPNEIAPAPQQGLSPMLALQGRYLIGAAEILGGANRGQFLTQLPSLEKGGGPERLAAAIVGGELGNDETALQCLERIRRDVKASTLKFSPEDQANLERLTKLYQGVALAEEDQTAIRKALSWHGDLALSRGADPATRAAVLGRAKRTAMVIFLGFGGAGIVFCLGVAGLIMLGAYAVMGRVRSALVTRQPRSSLYFETFALYLAFFLIVSAAAGFLLPQPLRLPGAGAAALSSLIVLVWPVIRGLSWQQVRSDIGLNVGRGFLREVAAGFASYAMMLPLLVAGAILMLLLMAIARKMGPGGEIDAPTHPAVAPLFTGDRTTQILLLLFGAVIAPIVEEIMFRGLMYRYLRDVTGRRMATGLSFLVSGLVMNFIFAAIHPQGWLAIPALMGIAFGLTVAREWRGSLIAPIMAHGLSNGLIMLLGVLATS